MKKVYYSWQQVEGAVLEIARQMSIDKWRPDYIVGLTRGGLTPANMLSQYLDIPMQTLKVSLRDSNDCESNLWMAEDAFGYVPKEEQEKINSRWDVSYRKNILVVDDINDSGATLNWIKEDWPSGCFSQEENVWNTVWHHSVRFAVLTHNLSSNFKDVDYHCWEVNKAEDDCWLVYPWEEYWKNER
jgi:hypoxanthine phosphoribosyltransferase